MARIFGNDILLGFSCPVSMCNSGFRGLVEPDDKTVSEFRHTLQSQSSRWNKFLIIMRLNSGCQIYTFRKNAARKPNLESIVLLLLLLLLTGRVKRPAGHSSRVA
jgi:hypothetical protein